MTNCIATFPPEATEEILATFGEARLLQSGGRIHLRGGSMADRTEALEWLAQFHPGAVACLEP